MLFFFSLKQKRFVRCQSRMAIAAVDYSQDFSIIQLLVNAKSSVTVDAVEMKINFAENKVASIIASINPLM